MQKPSEPTNTGHNPDHQATSVTARLNELVLSQLPFVNRLDYDFVNRGFIATSPDRLIKDANGRVIWDFAGFDFLAEDTAPPTVNPSLWRHAQLLCKHGLFKVTDSVYQVRAFDVSNMSIIVGKTGYIIVDPLSSVEVAAAALALVRARLGDKPVLAVIHTHTHTDHYAGVAGVVTEAEVNAGNVQIIVPEGFLGHVASENVAVGNCMGRRALYYQGIGLPFGPRGSMTCGLGPQASTGTMSLFAPTREIKNTGEMLNIDGVEIVFQMTPGTEAPAEMNFYFPQFKALCMAENASASIHNILTLRGAVVRDAKAWADYLTEALSLFGEKSDVMFTSHFWPQFGQERLNHFIGSNRDMYKYMHDQTVRLMNHGLTGSEIAEDFELPAALGKEWNNRGYYGSLSHNTKAIYQRYLGWYDGNPANLHSLPPVEAGKKYVEAFGGAAAVLAKAQVSFDAGEYRWTAQLLNHLVFADPSNKEARTLLAAAYEQMAFQTENGTWRGIYLSGAAELTKGIPGTFKISPFQPAVAAQLTGAMVLDYVSICLNGPAAARHSLVFNLEFSDTKDRFLVTVKNGVLVHQKDLNVAFAPIITTTRLGLIDLALKKAHLDDSIGSGLVKVNGDVAPFRQLIDLLDTFDFYFPIIEP